MLEPTGDVALEYATDSGAEDEEDSEEDESDGEEDDKSNNGRPQTKSARRRRTVQKKQEQLRKGIMRLSKGIKSDTSKKTKIPKLTRHQKWQVTKFGHESGIEQMKEEMSLTIQKASETIDMLLDETQHALWNQVLVKSYHTAGWKNERGEE